jgi:ABC-type glycerol-3-phosphate transport system substrate-binding protein
MKDKQQIARDYIIDLLEKGKLKGGDKMPGAREIAKKLDISLLIAQNAISTLVQDNVLKSLSRTGTFVREDWQLQALNFNIWTHYSQYSWFPQFKRKVEKIAPDLRVISKFEKGLFEIKTTLLSQVMQNEFMDLADIFDEAFPDKSIFHMNAAESFSSNGRLLGIPMSFSPRLLFYNKNLLTKAGLPEPEFPWAWEDFIAYVEKMKKIIPSQDVANWNSGINIWMNIVLRSGGSLIEPSDEDPVKIDSPETKRAFKIWKDLKRTLEFNPKEKSYNEDFVKLFAQNKKAFFIGSRVNLMFFKYLKFNDWGVVRLPVISPGCELCTQATETLCVRKECPRDMALLFVKTMLSKPIQDYMGSLPHGIPFLKESAKKSINENDPRDRLFKDEIPNISGRYFVGYPEFHEIINAGTNYLWESENNIDQITDEIASALRTLLKIGALPKYPI